MQTRQQLRKQHQNKVWPSNTAPLESSSSDESSEEAFDFVRGKITKELGRRNNAERPGLRNKT